MNLTDMETKVREATNNEPWGSPTTLMAQIASGTYNYREREEIISFIFRRFTEKAANEWRQIYKSLQLLDYLIKNGSERLIDDVRANISLIQMLKSFHYIDSKGRDQGINVRNRAKNLIALLNDDALIRSERKKARANAKKFGGVSSAAFGGASSITTGGTFEDDDFSNRVYGDGGVYGARYDDTGSSYNNGQSGNSNENFEEYDVGGSNGTSKATTSPSKVTARAKKASEPEPDLLGDFTSFEGSSNTRNDSTPAAGGNDDDDEFDDFQAAETQSQPQKPNISNNLASLYQSQPQNSFFPQQNVFSQQNTFASPQAPVQSTFQTQAPSFGINNRTPSSSSATGVSSNTKTAPKNDAFSSLFSSAKTRASSSPKPQSPVASNTNGSSTWNELNDDGFGGFASNEKEPINGSNRSNTTKNNDGEIDLLSF